MLAAYGTLHNHSAQQIRIVKVESDRFESATFHETTMTDDVARMRMLPNVTIMPKSLINFAPGGMHIMLMEPTAPVLTGQSIALQFTLKNGTQLSADFLVEKR